MRYMYSAAEWLEVKKAYHEYEVLAQKASGEY